MIIMCPYNYISYLIAIFLTIMQTARELIRNSMGNLGVGEALGEVALVKISSNNMHIRAPILKPSVRSYSGGQFCLYKKRSV